MRKDGENEKLCISNEKLCINNDEFCRAELSRRYFEGKPEPIMLADVIILYNQLRRSFHTL